VKKVHPKRRLMFQLIFLLLLISLVPLVISDRNLVRLNEDYLENDLLDSHTERARQIADEVSNQINTLVEKLEVIARLQPLTRSFTDLQKYQLLFFFLEEYKSLNSLTLLDVNGKTQAEVMRSGFSLQAGEERERIRERVLRQVLSGTLSISDPWTLPDLKEVYLTIGLPVFSEDRVGGVLLAECSLKKIREIIERVSIHRSGEAYLVDRKGRLIAHRNRDRALRQEDMKDVEIVGKYLALGKTGGALPFRDKNGREMLGAYAPLGLEGWGVVVQEPRKDAYIVVEEMKQQSLFWGGVTGVLVCLIGIFFARRISVPIMNFTRSALRIAEGNFKEKITVSARNEIGQLAETFNYMVRQLDLYDRNMRRLFMSAIASLAAAIDARDPYTRGHSERVTQYSLAISDEMNLDPKTREIVHIAALLHDVGKIGIDDSILRKPTDLTEEEYRLIQQHPEKGANIMAPIRQLREIIPAMRHHHERFDGKGYPDGIRGEEIPLPARIICVADTYDAMTSNRPYQLARDKTEALEQILSWSGTRYDPKVCEAFSRAFRKKRIQGEKQDLTGQIEPSHETAGFRPHIA